MIGLVLLAGAAAFVILRKPRAKVQIADARSTLSGGRLAAPFAGVDTPQAAGAGAPVGAIQCAVGGGAVVGAVCRGGAYDGRPVTFSGSGGFLGDVVDAVDDAATAIADAKTGGAYSAAREGSYVSAADRANAKITTQTAPKAR